MSSNLPRSLKGYLILKFKFLKLCPSVKFQFVATIVMKALKSFVTRCRTHAMLRQISLIYLQLDSSDAKNLLLSLN